MARRMTIVFDDEDLYTTLKVEAARCHRHAKDLVAEALTLMFEATPEEHETILHRAQRKGGAKPETARVETILAELGLSREPAPAAR